MATKTKSTPKKKAAPKKVAAKKKAPTQQTTFPPGRPFQIHPAHAVIAGSNRRPIPKALKKGKVAANGTVPVSGLKSGSYAVACELEDGSFRYFGFQVK